MSEIVEFLLARLDEDEQSAQSATPGPWDLNMIQPDMGGNHQYGLRSATTAGPIGAVSAGAFRMRAGDARHIARHDPTRALAEVEAKRRIVALHRAETSTESVWHDRADGLRKLVKVTEFSCAICGWVGEEGPHGGPGTTGCDTLRALALPYADHPDYRQEWRP